MKCDITALEVPIDEDLQAVSVFLRQQGVNHQVVESLGKQVILVADEQAAEMVSRVYTDWRSGALQLELKKTSRAPQHRSLVTSIASIPLTLVFILGSLLGFLLVSLDTNSQWVGQLTYVGFDIVRGHIYYIENQREWWRLFSPIFLHFTVLHIVFNSLWMWDIGGRIERQLGSLMLFGLVLSSAAVSNTIQYWVTGPSLFGGMSGVVYALLGFCWVAGKLRPQWGVAMPGPVIGFMVAWMFICMSGIIEVLGFGSIANGAHVGGLIIGAVLGVVLSLFYTQPQRLDP